MRLTNQYAGYSGTPLIKKLGIREETKIIIINPPDGYLDYLGKFPDSVILKTKLTSGLDFIHLFVKKQNEFENKFINLKKSLAPNGQIWISWPKKSSKVLTDITENTIREYVLKNGMVDVKVCSIDEIWSGLKLVIRLKDRPKH